MVDGMKDEVDADGRNSTNLEWAVKLLRWRMVDGIKEVNADGDGDGDGR